MSSPRRTADDDCVREEQREVNVLALMFITVVLAVMFVYDQWNTWRRETAWRRAARTATIRRTDPVVHECMTLATGAHAATPTQAGR
jgi:heme/copper-type cytochrome/quinol oxidase subunit 3